MDMASTALHPRTINVIPVWLRGRKIIWVLSAAVYIVLFSIWVFLKWTDPTYELLIANLGYVPLGFFAAICSLYTANQRHIIEERTRRAWQIIALSILFLVIADVIYLALELTKGIG